MTQMAQFETYRDAFANARLTRKPNGVLEVALHTDGGKLVFNGHTHEQFGDLFCAVGEGRDTRVVILTGTTMPSWMRPGEVRFLYPRVVTTRSCARAARC
jgi:hypothetical protein